jgi:hypothetical protein
VLAIVPCYVGPFAEGDRLLALLSALWDSRRRHDRSASQTGGLTGGFPVDLVKAVHAGKTVYLLLQVPASWPYRKFPHELLDRSIFGAKATTTFIEAALSYLESRQPKGSQRYCIAGWNAASPCLIQDFGDTLVNRIDQAMVNSVIRKRFADKKPGTIVCNFLTPLTAVLHHAAKQGWCDIPRPFTRPKFNDKRERWATPEEADGLLQHAGPHLRPLLLFLMLTGCRVAEAIDLLGKDIDFDQRWLVFRKTKRNEEARGVPIHLQLVDVLRQLYQASGNPEVDTPVFQTHQGQPYADHDRWAGKDRVEWRMSAGWKSWNFTCMIFVILSPHGPFGLE